MTLEDAKKLLRDLAMGDPPAQMQNYAIACKIGVEAIKRIEWERKFGALDTVTPLQGETN